MDERTTLYAVGIGLLGGAVLLATEGETVAARAENAAVATQQAATENADDQSEWFGGELSGGLDGDPSTSPREETAPTGLDGEPALQTIGSGTMTGPDEETTLVERSRRREAFSSTEDPEVIFSDSTDGTGRDDWDDLPTMDDATDAIWGGGL